MALSTIMGTSYAPLGAVRNLENVGKRMGTDLLLNFRELRKGEVRRVYLPRCEYPGEWLWATPRCGLTLFHAGRRCLASDSSAGRLGVAQRHPPGLERRDLIGACTGDVTRHSIVRSPPRVGSENATAKGALRT